MGDHTILPRKEKAHLADRQAFAQFQQLGICDDISGQGTSEKIDVQIRGHRELHRTDPAQHRGVEREVSEPHHYGPRDRAAGPQKVFTKGKPQAGTPRIDLLHDHTELPDKGHSLFGDSSEFVGTDTRHKPPLFDALEEVAHYSTPSSLGSARYVMKQAEWFFDFISPYSYLQLEQWSRLPHDLVVRCRPVLLAGLLDHWGQKGPAEVAPKRRFIYRHLQWTAVHKRIPFRFPAAHPFNPIKLLRLAVALNNDPEAIREIFRFVWRDGHLPTETRAWNQLLKRLETVDAEAKLQSPDVKQQLRDNGNRAIQLGVFGVPTFVVDRQLFWGMDSLEFFLDYLENPELLLDPEIRRIDELPVSAARRRADQGT